MPLIPITDLVPGMKVSKDVLNKYDVRLLSKHTIISRYIIEYLITWEVDSIYIEAEENEVIIQRRELQEKVAKEYNKVLDTTIRFMEGLKGSQKLKLDEIRLVINNVKNFTEASSMFDIVNMVKEKDKYIYQHSMNVAIYASFIGRWLDLEEGSLKKLMYAALLHDIGKTRVCKEILTKPGKLNDKEFEEIKKHAIYGYNIIKQNGNFSHSISLGVLQHHEREDGKGYPFGVDGEKIHLFAKIIAIADIYDAMTSNRAYKGRESVFKTIEELINNSFGKLDPKIVYLFADRLTDFYIGSTILLTDGRVGEIVGKNPIYPTKPLIKVENTFIDLSKEKHINIQDIFVA